MQERDTLAVWPGLLACGVIFGGIQFFWSNFMGAALVDILGGIGTLLLLAVFFHKVWNPKKEWRYDGEAAAPKKDGAERLTARRILVAWLPFILLSAFVVLWGQPCDQGAGVVSWKQPVPGLHYR